MTKNHPSVSFKITCNTEVVPEEEDSLKKVDIKTDDPKEYITFCDLCCPKGQDFGRIFFYEFDCLT